MHNDKLQYVESNSQTETVGWSCYTRELGRWGWKDQYWDGTRLETKVVSATESADIKILTSQLHHAYKATTTTITQVQ